MSCVITVHNDGCASIDWNPPNGPYVHITQSQWLDLCYAVAPYVPDGLVP